MENGTSIVHICRLNLNFKKFSTQKYKMYLFLCSNFALTKLLDKMLALSLNERSLYSLKRNTLITVGLSNWNRMLFKNRVKILIDSDYFKKNLSSEKKEKIEISKDLENWMGKLPEDLKKIPFIHLAIPGSHDSMTSSITPKSQIAPDAESLIKKLKWLGLIATTIISKWAKTQDFNAKEQLNSGIRYFDLRVATKDGTNKMYFVHSLYADEVFKTLKDIKGFIDSHPKEFLILDFQHFYELNVAHHSHLIKFIIKNFDGKLLPLTDDMTKLTLDYLTVLNNYQVAVIYRSNVVNNQPLLWPSYNFPNPWANKYEISKLLMKLDEYLMERHVDKAFITQCILTPNWKFIIKHFYSNLKTKCAVPLNKEQFKWIKEKSPGQNGVNIIINDFVNLDNSKFAREIIDLNLKHFK